MRHRRAGMEPGRALPVSLGRSQAKGDPSRSDGVTQKDQHEEGFDHGGFEKIFGDRSIDQKTADETKPERGNIERAFRLPRGDKMFV